MSPLDSWTLILCCIAIIHLLTRLAEGSGFWDI